jgi:hypothetical protein
LLRDGVDVLLAMCSQTHLAVREDRNVVRESQGLS